MAVEYARLISTSQGDIVGTGIGDRERTWLVKVSSVTDTEDTVYASGFLPLIGSFLDGNPQMTLRGYSPSREAKLMFRMTGRYSSRVETLKEREERQRELYVVPWFRSPSITMPVQEVTDEPMKDIDGKAIRNSFGTAFISTQPRRRWRQIIRVRAPVLTIPSWYYSLAEGFRNESAVTVTRKTGAKTYAARTLLFVPGEIQEHVVEGPYTYDYVNFELHFDSREHKWEPVDMGPKYLDSDEKETDFTDGLGFLDGTGHEGDPDVPYIHDFQYYDLASFADLPLTEF